MLMGDTLPLKLSLRLSIGPSSLFKDANILVSAFSNEWTGAYSPIASVAVLVLAMAFMRDYSMNSVNFRQCIVLNIPNNSIEEQLKMGDSGVTSIEIVEGADAEDVSN